MTPTAERLCAAIARDAGSPRKTFHRARAAGRGRDFRNSDHLRRVLRAQEVGGQNLLEAVAELLRLEGAPALIEEMAAIAEARGADQRGQSPGELAEAFADACGKFIAGELRVRREGAPARTATRTALEELLAIGRRLLAARIAEERAEAARRPSWVREGGRT